MESNQQVKFKETEIGKIPEEWSLCLFSQTVDVNPQRELRKGTIAKKVSMQQLKEFQRKITSYERVKYNGGPKFQNNDTLMARITPCLENGKTAFVNILDNNEIGFGSTEFNVLCGEEGKTNHKFVYYLCRSPLVRAETINSMIGTSGRQRVQNDVFDNILVPIPSIVEQESIAKILSDLDSKIELNTQMNKTLEAIGQAIFKHWFVDFEFPNEKGKPYKSSGGEMVDFELGEIPKGWEVKGVSDVVNIEYGKNLPTKRLLSKGYPVFGGNGIIGHYKNYLYRNPQVIVACRGAASGKILLTYPNSFITNNSLVLNIKTTEYLDFHYLKRYCDNADLSIYVTGSAQPQITIQNLSDFQILVPSEEQVVIYRKIVSSVDEQIYRNVLETKTLAKTRDSLLPRLISGRIRIDFVKVAAK